jgi:hypothetical protein
MEGVMKKIYLLLSLMFMATVCQSAHDFYGSERTTLWRSSYTETVDTNVLIASSSIHFRGVQIASAVANSYVFIYNNSNFTASVTTATKIDLSTAREVLFDIPLSSGLMYNKIGTAKVNFLWDWIITPLPGQFTKGQ